MAFINPKFIPDKSGIYLVGGCVRDRLIGRPTADFDLAVEADARETAESIASASGRRVVVMGEKEKRIYRVVTKDATYDVCLIKGADITEDLLSRDFTINAMAVNTQTHELIDPAGGRDDLWGSVVRMVSPEAFERDPLRMLRAFRIAAALGFAIDPETLEAISRGPERIVQTAGERIRDEWLRMLETPFSAELVGLAKRCGLLFAIFPELSRLEGCIQNSYHCFDAFEHTMAVYRSLEKMLHQERPGIYPGRKNRDLLGFAGSPGLAKHAALLHDVAKPVTRSVDEKGRVHFYRHERLGAQMVSEINLRLRFSNVENSYTSFMVKNHLRPLFLFILHERGRLQPKTRTRFFIKTSPWTPDLLMLFAADSMGKDPSASGRFEKFIKNLVYQYFTDHLPASRQSRLITGRDLIEHFGLTPSPAFKTILEKVEEMRLAGLLKNRDQALRFTAELLEKHGFG
ncbi:MAG: HDIG domain-containing metalloprotein [Thermodesulfobacteriota bacterium]